jgi:outer membrane protein TolC
LLAAQSARIGIAETELYPIISLTGTVGVAANQFEDLFRNGSSFGSVGPSLRWNILNYGRLLANIEVQDARFYQLLHSYRQTVLLANLEAESAIIEFLKSQERLESQLEAAEAADKTNDLINLLLEEGEADINRVFNVQNFKTQQEESAALAKGAVAQSYIAIYRALGGGWPSPFLRDAIIELPPIGEMAEAVESEEFEEELDAPPAEELPALDQAVPPPPVPNEGE